MSAEPASIAAAAGARVEPRHSLLDHFLRLFSDVRPGESLNVVLMLANVFLLLVGYYVLKTVREPLILATGGAEMKTYAAAGQALALMGFIPLYGWLASRVGRLRLIVSLTVFFIVCIELFYLGGKAGVPYLGFVFFIWVGIFSLASIAQFWAYANDIYTQAAGERLFPIIAIGATAGSPVGSWVASWLFERGADPYDMLQLTAGILLVHLLLYRAVNRRSVADPHQARATTESLGHEGGFALVFGSPYLRLAALLLILLNIVNTTGEYVLARSVVMAADVALAANASFDKESFIGSFYGSYFFWVNVATMLIQAFVASRLVKYLGFAGVLLALPLVAFGAYGLVAAGAGFAALRWAKTAENSTDYSIMNTARQLLWLPTTREEKYKAKQALDTFFVRAGDLLSAGAVFVGTTWVQLGVKGFALINLVVIAAWTMIALALVRENRRLSALKQAA